MPGEAVAGAALITAAVITPVAMGVISQAALVRLTRKQSLQNLLHGEARGARPILVHNGERG